MPIERQHYVSQGFLKGFREVRDNSDKFIWVYEKLQGRRPRCVSMRSVAWESFYYEQETPAGKRDTDTLEKAFAETIDNVIPSVIRAIDATPNSCVDLSHENREALAFFLGISFSRVPNFREGTHEFYSKIAQMLLREVAKDEPSISKEVEKNYIEVEAKSWVSLKPMMQMAEQIAHSVLNKNWQFFVPPQGFSLISSDCPVFFSSPLQQVGPAHPSSEIAINLRSDLALVCTPKDMGSSYPVFQMDMQEGEKFNRGTARAAGRYVFSNHFSPGIEKLTKKYSDEKQAIIVN